MSKNDNVKEMLQEELDKRIAIIESQDYQYVDKLNKSDYLGMLITVIVSIIVIIYGIIQ